MRQAAGGQEAVRGKQWSGLRRNCPVQRRWGLWGQRQDLACSCLGRARSERVFA